MQGTIKSLNEKKFGFIAVEGGDDVFFHYSELQDGLMFEDLKAGDVVTFTVEANEKGPRAKGITRAVVA